MSGLTAVPGVRVGHWTDVAAATGCTVVLLPAGTVASGEVRGGAPGTREWAVLAPGRLVQQVDAVVLAGGSAFGLAACDGVVRFCEERGVGFPTSAGPVPIVVGMVLYDLAVGDPSVRPGPAEGMAACLAARTGPVPAGRIGAGAGATVGKWRGPAGVGPGGLGSASVADGDVVVAALVAVNAAGDVLAPGQEPQPLPAWPVDPESGGFGGTVGTSTTIGVVATNAGLDKVGCRLVAAAVGGVDAPVDRVRVLAARTVAAAVRAAVP